MNAIQQLNKDILAITALIKDNYPVLMKYLEDITLDSVDATLDEMKSNELREYYDFLSWMVEEYTETLNPNSILNMN